MTEAIHGCAICARPIPRGKLMCWPHWRLVPRNRQQDVYRTWGNLLYGVRRQTADALTDYQTAKQAAIHAIHAVQPAAQATTPTGEPT